MKSLSDEQAASVLLNKSTPAVSERGRCGWAYLTKTVC